MKEIQKNKKIMYILSLLTLIFLIQLSFSSSYDEKNILLKTIEYEGKLYVLDIKVISNNSYYNDLLSYGIETTEKEYIINLMDDENNIISNKIGAISTYTLFPYDQETAKTKKIEIYSGEEVIYEKIISFCNNNQICESCIDSLCNTFENELTCEDCSQSKQDYFCNTEKDGICDSDCISLLINWDEDKEICQNNLSYQNLSFQEYPQDGILEKCSETFLGQICSEEEVCTGTFIDVKGESDRCCVKGRCIIEDKKDPIKTIKITWLEGGIISFVLLLLLILIIYFIKKKNIIVISLFMIFSILFSVFYFFPKESKIKTNELTGYITYEQLSDQQKEICKLAKQYQEKGYNIRSSLLLTIASQESGSNHYCHGCAHCIDGVCVSFDGGVGIMQIDHGFSPSDVPSSGPFYGCGNSYIDGHQLDIKNVKDNIECAIKEILGKCSSAYGICNVVSACQCNINSNCLDSNFKCDYDCTEQGYPFKTYVSWDIAIKGYNGWACGPFEANRQYVETFHARESQFVGACPDNIPIDDTDPQPGDPTDTSGLTNTELQIKQISETGKQGYYYINFLSDQEVDINLSEFNAMLSFANKDLIEQVHDCVFDVEYVCPYELIQPEDCKDDNDTIQQCTKQGEILKCYIEGSSNYQTYNCNYDFIQPSSCLDEDNLNQECVSKGEILKCRNDLKTYKSCAIEVLQTNSKNNWYIDYCPSDEEEKKCYEKDKVWDGKDCIKKPADYDSSQTLKICIETGDKIIAYEEIDEKYTERSLNLKFALTMHTKGIKEIEEETYDETPEGMFSSEYKDNICFPESLNIILFGDSNTKGHNDFGTPLNSEFTRVGQNINVKAIGLGGQRIESPPRISQGIAAPNDVFETDILPSDVNIVMLWFGMNDAQWSINNHYNGWTYEGKYYRGYNQIISELKQKKIIPLLLTTLPSCPESSSYYEVDEASHDEISERDIALAKSQEGVLYIDVRSKMKEVFESEGCTSYFYNDGVHINMKGHQLFSKIVVDEFLRWKDSGVFTCTPQTTTPQPPTKIYTGTYQSIFEQARASMGGTANLYTDCTSDIADWAWCWVHSGCHGYGIYCKHDKLAYASSTTLSKLFVHELMHTFQSCGGNSIYSEWGAEYYSGSQYYCFLVGGTWIHAQEVGQIMRTQGCSDAQLVSTAYCRQPMCTNPAQSVKPGGC